MEANITDIGNFDVTIEGLSMEDALKAMNAATTPRVKEAFRIAIETAKAQESAGWSTLDIEPGVVRLLRDGSTVTTLHLYRRPGRSFWQCHYKGRNVRRKTETLLVDAVIRLHELEDLL